MGVSMAAGSFQLAYETTESCKRKETRLDCESTHLSFPYVPVRAWFLPLGDKYARENLHALTPPSRKSLIVLF
jgi:hypothetical protein